MAEASEGELGGLRRSFARFKEDTLVPTAEDGWLSPRRGSLPSSDARRQREALQDATLQARAADVRCLLQDIAALAPVAAPEAQSPEAQRPRARGRRSTRDLFR